MRAGRRLALTSIALAAALLGAGLPFGGGVVVPGIPGFGGVPVLSGPAAARAAGDSDIPGIPLPGPVVEGRLGGGVYDHVYSVSVPAQHVLVASLSGSAGSDFDLYLYDTTATTVWGTAGLLASSTGPTSSESIAWPSQIATTYYLDLHGFGDIEGEFRLTVAVLPDATVPQVSVEIDGGGGSINTSSVQLSIRATDDLSGVVEMQLSADGSDWNTWQAYVSSLGWTLSPGDGTKYVFVRVRDRAGNISAAASASVVLDTVAPTVVEVTPVPNATCAGLRPTFTVKFDSPIRPETWLDMGLLVQLGTSWTPVPGTYAYDALAMRGSFRPSSPLIAGAAYRVSLGEIADAAGNRLASTPWWTVTPLATADLALRVAPSAPSYGDLLSLAGTAVLPEPAAVQVERRYATSTEWTVLTSSFPGTSGQITWGDVATRNADYRLHYAGGPLAAESWSTTTRVSVRARVTLTGLTPGVTKSAKAGATVTLRALTSPIMAGTRVDFRLYRYDAARRAYVLAATYTRVVDSAGRASLAWRLRAGTWQVRVATRATPDLAAGLSPVYRWVVRAPVSPAR